MAYISLNDLQVLSGLNSLGPRPNFNPLRVATKAAVTTIPEGFHGTADTIKEMRRLARLASIDPQFVMFCRSLVAGLPSKAYYKEAERIFEFVRKHVRYVLDPRGMEYVQDPRWTVFVDGAEDCDGHSCLIAAIALSLGHEAAFETVGVDPNRPDDFSHVYALIGIQKGLSTEWWAADTTQKNVSLGWRPPKHAVTRTKTWPV